MGFNRSSDRNCCSTRALCLISNDSRVDSTVRMEESEESDVVELVVEGGDENDRS